MNNNIVQVYIHDLDNVHFEMHLQCLDCLYGWKQFNLLLFCVVLTTCAGFVSFFLSIYTDQRNDYFKNTDDKFKNTYDKFMNIDVKFMNNDDKFKNTDDKFMNKNVILKRKIPNNIEQSNNPKFYIHKQPLTNFNYKDEISKLNDQQTDADDPRLVALIRDYFIIPPSNQAYQLDSNENLDQSRGQAPFVDNRLGYKKNGFFVESGAYDGEQLSNTLMLERLRHWTGVLIEPNPAAFEMLRKKHRKVYAINACLSTEPYPSQKILTADSLQSRIIPEQCLSSQQTNGSSYCAQCFSLYSILLAINVTTVDYLSLDVEGNEHGVLGTIPWHKIKIQMLSIEYDKWPGGSRSLCKYMEHKGYECLLTMSGNFVADAIFRKKSRRRVTQ